MHDEDGEYRRRVEHGTALDVRAVVDHRRQRAVNLAQDVFAYNDNGNTGRTYVLLGTTVNQTVFLDIDRTAHEIGRHISHQGYRAVDVFLDFGTVNGVVGRDMEVVGIGRDGPAFGNMVVSSAFRRSNHFNFAEQLGFLHGFVSPNACIQISGFLVEKVERNIAELGAGTATEEKNVVTFRNVVQLFPQSYGFVHNRFPFLGTVGDFDNRHSGSLEVFQSFDTGFNCGLRQFARAGIENMHFFHNYRCFKFSFY